jgi:hypothetical protein
MLGYMRETNLTLVLNVAKHGAAIRNIAIQRRSSEGFVEIFKVRTLRFKKMAGLPGLTNYKNNLIGSVMH